MRRRPSPRLRAGLLALLTLLTLLSSSATRAQGVQTPSAQTQDEGDAGRGVSDITRAIAAAAYVIVDVRAGRTVREQRAEWLDTPVWPGSIAKLATFAAALDAHTLFDRTRIVCTRRVTLPGGRVVDCSHPPLGHALSPVEAIAHSCNVFAASIARTLTRAQLSHGFVQLGLAPLPSTADPLASALGLDGAKVAPRRLIEPILRSGDSPSRHVLWDGLRESARTGTSSAFEHAGIDALAKTGTAPMRSGRALGLVSAVTPSSSPRFAIVVALPGGTGAQAAETAAAILESFLARQVSAASPRARVVEAYHGAVPTPAEAQIEDAARSTIRVGRPRTTGTGYDVETVPLEDYVARVVAGETSSATPTAAREALAVTARTYAVVNRGRHAADGFDLCTLTHCQVTRPASADARAAAERTRGRLLVRAGRPVPVFYSASCGGTLVDPRALLPEADPGSMPWLAPRVDPSGADERTWQTDIPARELLSALQRSGYRGDALRNLTAHTASTGLVTDVRVDGLVPSTLTADDFRRAIGQQLGWHLLKSLRFTIQRTSAGYSFAGRGHGHGVGLCVLGASALATRGADAARILDTYFPGLQRARLIGFAGTTTSTSTAPDPTAAPSPVARETRDGRDARAGGPTTPAPPNAMASGIAARAPTPTSRDSRVGASAPPPALAPVSRIALRLPSADEGERQRLLRLIDTDLRDLTSTLALTPPESLAVVVHPTGDSYRRATRSPWWTSGTTIIETDRRGTTTTLHLAPLSALDRGARLEQTLRHELVHVLTVGPLADRPRWVHEGLAIHLAGERVSVAPASAAARRDADDSACPSDRELRRASDRAAFDRAYSRAAACVARELDAGRAWRDLGAR